MDLGLNKNCRMLNKRRDIIFPMRDVASNASNICRTTEVGINKELKICTQRIHICVYMCVYYKPVTEVCAAQAQLNQVCFETAESNFFSKNQIFSLYFSL